MLISREVTKENRAISELRSVSVRIPKNNLACSMFDLLYVLDLKDVSFFEKV